jgi:hypothetical protein
MISEMKLIDIILIHSGDAIVEYLEKEFNFTTKYEKPILKFFSSFHSSSCGMHITI